MKMAEYNNHFSVTEMYRIPILNMNVGYIIKSIDICDSGPVLVGIGLKPNFAVLPTPNESPCICSIMTRVSAVTFPEKSLVPHS